MADFDSARVERLLGPERYRRQNPEAILNAIGITSGVTFADIGCGPGFFTLRAAEKVGPSGIVYALDVDPKMLEILRARADQTGITNVKCVVAKDNALPLRATGIDIALLADVLHEVPERAELLAEIARVLRPGGLLAVIEWQKEEMEMGPALAKRLSYEQIDRSLRAVGFEHAEPFDAGVYHYGVKARRQ